MLFHPETRFPSITTTTVYVFQFVNGNEEVLEEYVDKHSCPFL